MEFPGVRGDILPCFVLVASEPFGRERGKHLFVGFVADGVFAPVLIFGGTLHSFALPFVSVKLAAAIFEELAYPCRNVLAAHVVVSHDSVDAGGKAREEEHHFGEVQGRVSSINDESEVFYIGRAKLVGRRKRLYILVNLFAEPRHGELVAAFAPDASQRRCATRVAA